MIKRNIQHLTSLLLLSVFCVTQLASAAVPGQGPKKPFDHGADPKILKLTRCLQDNTGTAINKHCKDLSWKCYVHILAKLAQGSTNYKELVAQVNALSTLENKYWIGYKLSDLVEEFSDVARAEVKKEVDKIGKSVLLDIVAERVALNKAIAPAKDATCSTIKTALFGAQFKDEL